MQTPKAILFKFFEHILYINAGGCCKPEEDMLVITKEPPHLSLGALGHQEKACWGPLPPPSLPQGMCFPKICSGLC